jgi:hypothetical protein
MPSTAQAKHLCDPPKIPASGCEGCPNSAAPWWTTFILANVSMLLALLCAISETHFGLAVGAFLAMRVLGLWARYAAGQGPVAGNGLANDLRMLLSSFAARRRIVRKLKGPRTTEERGVVHDK